MADEESNNRRECFDPRLVNIEGMPQLCGNDVFQTVEEYKKIEAHRLGKTPDVEAKTDISIAEIPNHDSNGQNGTLESYVPDLSDPIQLMCCAAHVFRDSNGNGHFQTNEAWRVVRIIGNFVNQRYAYPSILSDPPTPPPGILIDTRIRFDIPECKVSFYNDTTLHNSTSQSALQAAAVARNPDTLKYLNIYFTNGSMGGASAFATLPSTNPAFDSWVVMLGSPLPQSNFNFNGADWAFSNTMAHELGHVLDLYHTYPGGGAPAVCTIGPDFLSDVFGTSPSTCPHFCDWATNAFTQEPRLPNVVITNNLMSGNKDNGSISRLQAATMHQALKHKNVKRYLATGCNDCGSCVAFMVRGMNHLSSGGRQPMAYATLDLNEGWGWTMGLNAFIAPVPGIYQFDVSFMGGATGGSSGEVFVFITKNGTMIGRGRNGAMTGQRSAAAASVNVRLQTGDRIQTMADSVAGTTRTVVEYGFEGHLVCGCC
jgi:hypothetical protein